MRRIYKRTLWLLIVLIALPMLAYVVLDYLPLETAPFDLPTEPVIVYRIAGSEATAARSRGNPHTVFGYAILQRRVVTDPQLIRELRSALTSRFTYGQTNYLCFEPGIAIEFGAAASKVTVLICLDCAHAYFYRGSDARYRNLNGLGVHRFKSLYSTMFPGRDVDQDEQEKNNVTEKITRQELAEIEAEIGKSALKSASISTQP